MISWHRYYDPETGRYVSADPIGLEGGMNLYAYVADDPVNNKDPEGLFSIDPSFTDEQKIEIMRIFPDLLSAIQSSGCIKSEGLKNCLLEKLTNLNIKYNKNLKACGQANWTGFSDTIQLGNSAFKNSKCGPVKSTILHEMIHSQQFPATPETQ